MEEDAPFDMLEDQPCLYRHTLSVGPTLDHRTQPHGGEDLVDHPFLCHRTLFVGPALDHHTHPIGGVDLVGHLWAVDSQEGVQEESERRVLGEEAEGICQLGVDSDRGEEVRHNDQGVGAEHIGQVVDDEAVRSDPGVVRHGKGAEGISLEGIWKPMAEGIYRGIVVAEEHVAGGICCPCRDSLCRGSLGPCPNSEEGAGLVQVPHPVADHHPSRGIRMAVLQEIVRRDGVCLNEIRRRKGRREDNLQKELFEISQQDKKEHFECSICPPKGTLWQ